VGEEAFVLFKSILVVIISIEELFEVAVLATTAAAAAAAADAAADDWFSCWLISDKRFEC
jgi:hypothetical protein